MKQNNRIKRLAAAALMLALVLALAACGGQNAATQETKVPEQTPEATGPSATLKGIYEALTAADSDYSRNKELYLAYYPELEYTETLGEDRITISLNANGNEYISDGFWEFVEEGDYLTAVMPGDDYNGAFYVMNLANAIGSYYGMETDLISGYLNGLGAMGIESGNFRMIRDEAAGTTTYQLNIAGPWDMKELDQMVLDGTVMDYQPLTSNYISQSGSVGKIRMIANGSVDDYTMLFAEYGALDDIAYRSIVNMVKLREPAGWEAFLDDFTELKAVKTDEYLVDLNPDDATIADIMSERDEKFSYALVRFGSGKSAGGAYEAFVPSAEAFADFYFRVVAGYQKGVAGASLSEAEAASAVLGFAAGNELWNADIETLRTNMLEGWESLTDDERANFDANFPDLVGLMNACFEDWNGNRGRFDDAGVADAMEENLAMDKAKESWDMLNAHTWTLGNSE